MIEPGEKDGLQEKFRVERLTESSKDHSECRYFVLDPQHDPAARGALEVYAHLVQHTHPGLYRDLHRWLIEFRDSSSESTRVERKLRSRLEALDDDH